MRILCTGGQGMAGWGVKQAFMEHDLVMTGKGNLNVTNIDQVMIYRDLQPDIIFHMAAETDHLRAEISVSNTYMVNHTGTMNMVELARELDVPIVYWGTCGIFDGKKDKYSENDIASPVNHYGRSKWFGELAVRSYKRHFIVRSGWGMGGGRYIDKKFVAKVYQKYFLGEKEIPAIADVYGSPTYTLDFAMTLKNILTKQGYGTYCIASPDRASRYDVAKEFFNIVNPEIRVIPMSHEEYHKKFGLDVPYTKCEVVDTSKIENLGVSCMSPWREALRKYAVYFA